MLENSITRLTYAWTFEKNNNISCIYQIVQPTFYLIPEPCLPIYNAAKKSSQNGFCKIVHKLLGKPELTTFLTIFIMINLIAAITISSIINFGIACFITSLIIFEGEAPFYLKCLLYFLFISLIQILFRII